MHFFESIRKVLIVFLLGFFVWSAPKDLQIENFSFVSTAQAEDESWWDDFTGSLGDELQCLWDKGLLGAAGYGTKNAVKGLWNALASGINTVGSLFGKNPDISKAEIESCTEEGKTFERIYSSFTGIADGCWFCPVFKSLYNTINGLASKMNNAGESGSLANVIAGGMGSLLWLLLYGYIIFKVGQMLITSAFKGLSPMDVFTEVFYPFLRCVVAAILIHSSTAIFTYLVDPLLVASISFGQIVQTKGNASGMTDEARMINATIVGGITSTTCATLTYGGSTTDNAKLNSLTFATSDRAGRIGATFNTLPGPGANKVFSDAVGNSIQCFLTGVSQNLIVWMAVGAAFIADSWGLGFMHILPHWTMLFVGIIVFLGAFLIFLSFPLKLLDAMFRLLFVSALMPLWIAFWVIPQTRKYTQSALNMLIHIMVNFIILSVVLVMVYEIIKSIFDKSTSGIDLETMVNLLEEDKSKEALEKVDFNGVGIFMCAALMYLAFSLIGKAETFVNQFAKDGGSFGIGKDVSGRVTQGTQMVGKVGVAAVGAAYRTVGKTAAGMAWGATKWAAGKAASPVKNWGTKVKNAYNEGKTEGATSPDTDSKAYKLGHFFGEAKKDFRGERAPADGGRPREGGEEGRPRSTEGTTVQVNSDQTRAAPTILKGEKGEKGDTGKQGKDGKMGEQGEKGEKAEETKPAETVVRKPDDKVEDSVPKTNTHENSTPKQENTQTTVIEKTTVKETTETQRTPVNYFTPSKKEGSENK